MDLGSKMQQCDFEKTFVFKGANFLDTFVHRFDIYIMYYITYDCTRMLAI